MRHAGELPASLVAAGQPPLQHVPPMQWLLTHVASFVQLAPSAADPVHVAQHALSTQLPTAHSRHPDVRQSLSAASLHVAPSLFCGAHVPFEAQ
jgi:hypothetical protein